MTVGEEAPLSITGHIFAAVRRYVAVLLFGALLLWLAPALLQEAASRLRQQPLPSLTLGLLELVGFVVTVVVSIAVAALVAVVLGLLGLGSLVATTILATLLGVAALCLAFAVAVVFVADAVAGLTLGRLVSAATAPRPHQLAFMALGLVPVVVLTALSVVGGWVRFLVVLFGLGALLLAARAAARRRPAAGASPSAAET